MNDRLNTESDMYPCSLSDDASTRCHVLQASRTLNRSCTILLHIY